MNILPYSNFEVVSIKDGFNVFICKQTSLEYICQTGIAWLCEIAFSTIAFAAEKSQKTSKALRYLNLPKQKIKINRTNVKICN